MNSLFHLAAPEWTLLTNPERLQALAACGIFASTSESEFNDIVTLAALSCQCSSAVIAFADGEDLHFKSTVGANKPLLKVIAECFFVSTVQRDHFLWSSSESKIPVGCDEEARIAFYAGVALRTQDNQIVGILCVTDPEPRQLSHFQVKALLASGRQTERQLTLRRLVRDQFTLIKQRDDDLETWHALRERALLRDVLASVTEGKLILADTDSHLPEQLPTKTEPIVLDSEGGLAELRQSIRDISNKVGLSDLRAFDLMTAASEAGMNAIVHAGSGIATLASSANGTIQIRIQDRGSGIAFTDLPKATLARGYSTKATLGHGLKMILETIDRIYLMTGPTGTTLVLEQELTEPSALWQTGEPL